MEQLINYVNPELLILIPVLYIIGVGFKKSQLNNKHIPLVLGIAGIVLAAIWTVAKMEAFTLQTVLTGIFAGLTQGILVAGASVYVNQLIKQESKSE